MKYLYTIFSLILVSTLFTNCAGNKNMQGKAPAQIQQTYYTTQGDLLKLHIPVTAIQEDRVILNSVYFRGKKADLQQDSENSGLFVATINTGKPDLIMSSDPKEEYKNKAPQISEKQSFELKENEAVLIFTENGKEKYYKIAGIEERSAQ